MSAPSYERHVGRLQNSRQYARALQTIMEWSILRTEGSCPEISDWEPDAEDEGRFFVDHNHRSVYQLVTPGRVRTALYFDCSPPANVETDATETDAAAADAVETDVEAVDEAIAVP